MFKWFAEIFIDHILQKYYVDWQIYNIVPDDGQLVSPVLSAKGNPIDYIMPIIYRIA